MFSWLIFGAVFAIVFILAKLRESHRGGQLPLQDPKTSAPNERGFTKDLGASQSNNLALTDDLPEALERIAEKKQYKNQYKCLYGNKGCGENAVYCEPCNERYEHFLWLLNDDR